MRLFCVHKIGTIFDDKDWFDLVTHEEFNNGIVKEHEERLLKQQKCLDRHDSWLRTHDKSIQGVTKTVERTDEELRKHADRIWWIEQEFKKITQKLHETLGEQLKESLVPQLDIFEGQLAMLKEEREAVSRQLNELQQLRTDIALGSDAMKKQCAEVGTQLEELRQQREEAKAEFALQLNELQKRESAIPVPRRFARFLFMKTAAQKER